MQNESFFNNRDRITINRRITSTSHFLQIKIFKFSKFIFFVSELTEKFHLNSDKSVKVIIMQSLISKQTENVLNLYKSLFRGFHKKVWLICYDLPLMTHRV